MRSRSLSLEGIYLKVFSKILQYWTKKSSMYIIHYWEGHHEGRSSEFPSRQSEHPHQEWAGGEDEAASQLPGDGESGGAEVQSSLLDTGGGPGDQPGDSQAGSSHQSPPFSLRFKSLRTQQTAAAHWTVARPVLKPGRTTTSQRTLSHNPGDTRRARQVPGETRSQPPSVDQRGTTE